MHPDLLRADVIRWSAFFALGLIAGAFAVWSLSDSELEAPTDAAASVVSSERPQGGALPPPGSSPSSEPEATVGRVSNVDASGRSVAAAQSRRPAIGSRRVVSPPKDRGIARSDTRAARRSDAAGASATKPQARARGGLTIDSVPRGARVSLDGQPVGSTVLVLDNVPAGTHLVRLEADGYQVWAWTTQVVTHRQNTLTVKLVPVPTHTTSTSTWKALK